MTRARYDLAPVRAAEADLRAGSCRLPIRLPDRRQQRGCGRARRAGGPASFTMAASLPAVGQRELRLDLFRGLALWLIYIDHVSPDLLVLVHHPQLRVQRRRRDLHFHLRLYRGLRLRPLDAAIRFCHRGGAGAAPGLADLCHAHPAVHGAGGGSLLHRRRARQAVLRQGNGDHRFPQSARPGHGPGAAAALSPAQHGRAAALHRADGLPAADPGPDQMAAQSDAGDVGRALRAVLAL